MAEKVERRTNIWLHLKIIYFILAVVTIGAVSGIWVCMLEIQRLKRDFVGEIMPKGMAEFTDRGNLLSQSQSQTWEASYTTVSSQGIASNSKDEKDYSVTGLEGEDEELLRVRRHTNRSDKRPPPFFYGRNNPREEGSGTAGTEDWVWLTSYSRIPVFALQEFCSATKEYCPPSAPGLRGPPGLPGVDGKRGRRGHKGESGKDGVIGDVGPPGDKGDRGDKGHKGDLGTTGKPGIDGIQGKKGDKGDIGPPGVNGTQGPAGPKAEKGQKGEMGLSGFPGYHRNTGYMSQRKCFECKPGPPGPPGPPGKSGRLGPPGPEGSPGFNGTDGLPGSRGRRGRKGHEGPQGMPGEPGKPGPPGERGKKGDTGSAGITEIDAATFNCSCRKGDKGNSGEKGRRGLIGFIGYKGEIGPAGPPGPPGPIMEGIPGPQGPSGLVGPRGQKGEKGEPGNNFVAGSNQVLENYQSSSTIPPTTTPMPSTTIEPIITARTNECRIRMVGKPLFHRYTTTYWGSWMRDPRPARATWAGRVWYTRHFSGKSLIEYENYNDYKLKREFKHYRLRDMFMGTGHVMYNGAFFYHHAGYNEVIKFDLEQETITAKTQLWYAAYQGDDYVYSTAYNYVDLAVDENGLWAIYGSNQKRDSLLVVKLNHNNLRIEKMWNITVDHQKYGNGFIVCGVLYLVKDTSIKNTFINFAYDLYRKEEKQVNVKFTNPFKMNNMIAYNPADHKLYSWDKGNQLTYPLLV